MRSKVGESFECEVTLQFGGRLDEMEFGGFFIGFKVIWGEIMSRSMSSNFAMIDS